MNMAYTGGYMPRRGRGFTLIEMSIVITLAGVLLMILYQQSDRMSRNAYGATTGQYMAAMAVGLGKYLDIYYDVLGNVTSPSQVAANAITGRVPQYSRVAPRIIAPADQNQDSDVARSSWLSSGALPTPSTAYSAWSDAATKAICADQMCAEITVADLIAANVVSPDFPETAPNGMRFTIRIRRNASILPASDCNSSRIDAVIVADGPAMGPNGEGVDTDGIQIGDAETMAGMAQTMENHGAHPLMFARSVVNGDLTAIGAITPAVPAAITPANGEMSFFGASDQIHNTLGPFVRASIYGLDPAAIKEGTPLVRISDWHGNPDGAYFRTDGTCPMRGDVDMGRHSIKNFLQVNLGDDCITVGARAQVANNPNIPLGYQTAGYGAICVFDAGLNRSIWKTEPQGLIADVQGGTREWQVTNAEFSCWGGAANDGAALADYSNGATGVYEIVFMVWHGDVWAYARGQDGNYHDVTRTGGIPNSGPGTGPAGGYDISYNWSWSNNQFGFYPMIVSSASGTVDCITPITQDPTLYAGTSWNMSSSGVQFNAIGVWRREAINPNTSAGDKYDKIPVSVTGDVPTSSTSCDGLGVCTTTTGSASVTMTGQTSARGYGSYIDVPVSQHKSWSFLRTLKCGGNGSAARPTSIAYSCIF